MSFLKFKNKTINLNIKTKKMSEEDLFNFLKDTGIFERYYEKLKKSDFSCLINRRLGTNTFSEIEMMLQYFEEKEQYEKCSFLLKLQLPKKASLEMLNSELEWLKLNNI